MEKPDPNAPARSALAGNLWLLTFMGVLLLAAIGAGGITLYKQVYGPGAFVTRYVDLLAQGRAADALLVPGVSLAGDAQANSPLEPTASEALLRSDALASISDVAVVSEKTTDEITDVTISYRAGGHPGSSTFSVERNGWTGVVPEWRFARSPIAEADLTVVGSDSFAVNGFEVDRRQVSVDGANAQGTDPVRLLVFTPGLYSVTIDTPIAHADAVGFLADSPLTATPVTVRAKPTEKFLTTVQERVEEFLSQCATQQVLQPTACPFGYPVQDRLDSLPTWSITQQPTVSLVAAGNSWVIPITQATAHIDVAVKSLYDGKVQEVSEDVPFDIDGTVEVLGDGAVSIRVGAPAME